MSVTTEARRARRDYLRAIAKERALRTRVIFHRKRGEKAARLKRALLRARRDRVRLKHRYLVLKTKATAPLHRKALSCAYEDVGVLESGGNNRGTKVVRIIHDGGGKEGEAWCVWAVIAWYLEAGSKADWAITWGAVSRLHLVDGLKRTIYPVAGCVVRFVFSHTGLFICWCNAAGKRRPRLLATHIKTVEGNTGTAGAVSDSANGNDGVRIKIRPKWQVQDYLKPTK